MKDPNILKNKELKEIRPARGGVKMKSKTPVPPKVNERSRVIQNVNLPSGMSEDNLEPPSEEAIKIISRINDAKVKLQEAMRSFVRLVNDPKLPENRSEREKQEERLIIDELIRSSAEVERLDPGEGLLSLCVFSTRLSLSLKNAGNKVAHKIHMLEKRLSKLEVAAGIEPEDEDPKAKEKRLLLEQAEKLGIKITIED